MGSCLPVVGDGFKGVAISVAQAALPFLADEQPGDRAVGRVAASLVVGAVAGLICLILSGLIAITAFTFVASLIAPPDARAPVAFNTLLLNPELAAHSVRLSLVLIVMAASTTGGFVLGFLAVASKLTHRGFFSYFTVAPHFRWGLVLVGLALNGLLTGPLLLWEYWGEISAGHLPLLTTTSVPVYRLGFVLVTAGGLFIAALAEEVFFRGWLLRHASAILRNRWVAIVLASLLFSAAHGEFTPAPFITRAIMGLGLAWMTLRTGGVELSAGVHMANNLMLALLVKGPSGSSDAGSALSPGNLLDFGAIAVIYVLIAEVVARALPLAEPAGISPTLGSSRA